MKRTAICICFLVVGFFLIPTTQAAGPLTQKWQIDLSVSYGAFHPSMGDVDNDGAQEIVVKLGDYVNVLNGKTGDLKWRSPRDATGGSQILELADLNGDGVPEIVYCGTGLRVYARDGKGNLIWRSESVSGEYWPGTPIVTGDTNNDGYAELYVVTQDTTAPYTACITKLNHDGKIEAKSEICTYPCWGGLSLADPSFDGNYKIYLGDRAASGGPGGSRTSYPSNPARGVSCYDASTLKTLWVRPDIYSSTPAPVLIDVNGDGVLDVVANNILNNGAYVLDATTGSNIYNWRGVPINNHAKGTVWDVDGDGHIELISSWGYQDTSRCTKDFTVLDLVSGKIEYRATDINNYLTYPPTVGNVYGDGDLEILAATSGEPGHGVVGQGMLYIYDGKYNVIQRISGYPMDLQLWEPYCVDCDGDGLNEVLVANIHGQVWCYDTPGKASPGMKPWSAWYSPYRQGAAVYTQPLGKTTPVEEPTPVNSYSLTVQAPTGYGATNPRIGTRTYSSGTIIQFTATPATGWTLDHWIVDGTIVTYTDQLTLTMDSSHTVKPVFVRSDSTSSDISDDTSSSTTDTNTPDNTQPEDTSSSTTDTNTPDNTQPDDTSSSTTDTNTSDNTQHKSSQTETESTTRHYRTHDLKQYDRNHFRGNRHHKFRQETYRRHKGWS